jgi:hypothetical protein
LYLNQNGSFINAEKQFNLSSLTFACLCALSATTQAQTSPLVTNQLTAPVKLQQHFKQAQVIADEYIVFFKQDTADAEIERIRTQINLQHGADDKDMRRFSVVKGLAGKIPKGLLKKLATNPQVKLIEANQTVTLPSYYINEKQPLQAPAILSIPPVLGV